MRARLTTLLELAGMGSVTTGVALVSFPAGLVVGGVFAVLVGFLVDAQT